MKLLVTATIALCAATGIAQAEEWSLYDDHLPLPAKVDWNGFYMGLVGGGGAGTATSQNNVTIVDMIGLNAGLRLGFDIHRDAMVVGALGTIQASTLYGGTVCGANPAANCDAALLGLATLEGRVGLAADKALAYIKGGMAFGYG